MALRRPRSVANPSLTVDTYAAGLCEWHRSLGGKAIEDIVGAFAQDLRADTPTMVTTLHSFIDYMKDAGCDSCVLHPSKLEQGIKDAFLSLERGTEAGDAVLKPFKADGFAAITDADYDIIRDIRKNLQSN